MKIIVPKGIPVLPLGDFDTNEHQHENEILLPPGIDLVFLEKYDYEIGDEAIEYYVYAVRLRSSV